MLPRTGVPSDGLALELRRSKVKVEEGMENREESYKVSPECEVISCGFTLRRKRNPLFCSLTSQT